MYDGHDDGHDDGHYRALVNDGNGWCILDDDIKISISKIPVKFYYIIIYVKTT